MMKKKSPSPKLCAMPRRAPPAAAAPAKEAPAKEAPSPSKGPGKRVRSSEAETAAADAAAEAADIEDSTDMQASSQHLPPALLERRLSKSNDTIKKLETEKAEMQKKVAELLEAHKKRNEEEAKAGKLAKLVAGASPGAVVQVGRQVHSYLLPCFRVNNVIFCSQKLQARVKPDLLPESKTKHQSLPHLCWMRMAVTALTRAQFKIKLCPKRFQSRAFGGTTL